MADLLEVDDLALQTAGFGVRLPSLRLGPGQAAVLYGPSGCGKTTLLLGLCGLQDAAFVRSGAVRVGGEAVANGDGALRRQQLRQAVGYALQDGIQALDPLRTVGAQLLTATGQKAADVAALLTSLRVLDAEAVLARHPHRISGGQAQRALLAAALLRQGRVLLLDEPTASLDPAAVAVLMRVLQEQRAAGRAVLCATHDARVLAALQPQVLLPQDGAFLPGRVDPLAWPVMPNLNQAGDVLLAARGIDVGFAQSPVLTGIDLELRAGSRTVVLGESGSGKTTLLRALAGLLRPEQGRIERHGSRRAAQILFQDAAGSLTPGRSLRALLRETAVAGFDAVAMAARVGLSAAHLDRTVQQLSGGERRRAGLLRAMSVWPSVLLLDEPTASLDHEAALAVVELLVALQRDMPLAVLIATHDEAMATAIADRVFRLQGGRLIAC